MSARRTSVIQGLDKTMCKLYIYRADHGSFAEALKCEAVYQSTGDALEPEFVDGPAGRVTYLSDMHSAIQTVCNAAGRDDLVFGTVIKGIFWELEELIDHFEKINEWPSENYPEKVEKLAQDAHKGCGLIYELFASRYVNEIDNLVFNLPKGVKDQVIKLAENYGYEVFTAEQQAEEQWDDDVHYCSHGIEADCCPAGCGDLDDVPYDEMQEPSGYNEAGVIHSRVESMIVMIKQGKNMSPLDWCMLKQYVHSNPDACAWYDDFFTDPLKGSQETIRSTGDLIRHLQRLVLDACFDLRLNKRVEDAKNEVGALV